MNGSRIERLLQAYRHKVTFAGAQNAKIAEVRRLRDHSHPDRRFLIDGMWGHQKALLASVEIVSFLICPELVYSEEAVLLAEQTMKRAADIYVVSGKLFAKLCERDEPDGMLSIGIFPLYDAERLELKPEANIVVLDGLETPGNIGTILRTCDGAGIDAVFICNKKARITHSKLLKGSMGAAFIVPIVEFEDVRACRQWLGRRGFTIYLADTRAETPYDRIVYSGNTALVMGSERYGISPTWYEGDARLLSIPMSGCCDSLNVAVAASIILYAMSGSKRGWAALGPALRHNDDTARE